MLRDRIESSDVPHPLASPCGLERLEDRVLLDALTDTDPVEPTENIAPVADAGGPYDILVDGFAALNAGYSYDPDGTFAELSFLWDFNGDGEFGTEGDELSIPGMATTPYPIIMWADMVAMGRSEPGDYEIGVQVTDADLASAIDTTTLKVWHGEVIEANLTAEIGFWRTKKGRELIRLIVQPDPNEPPNSMNFAGWMAAMMPNTFGNPSSALYLLESTNVDLYNLFDSMFRLKVKDGVAVAPKAEAQLLAVGLSTWVTTQAAGPAVNDFAIECGFDVTLLGLWSATFVPGEAGTVLGLAADTQVTVACFLTSVDNVLWAQKLSPEATEYDPTEVQYIGDLDGDGIVDTAEERLIRSTVNELCAMILEAGSIS